MNKNISENLTSYLILFSGLIIGFFFFLFFSYNRQLQLVIGIFLSLYYLSWGVINHLLKKDLTLKVLFEYILISLLGIVILTTLLLRT